METQIKNKSILIDPEQHQKVKVLADQFKVSVKQLVEDMINYSHKTGFNPTVMTRDRVMEKLNQIQKSIDNTSKSELSNIQNTSKVSVEILQKIKDDFQEFYSVVSKNKDFTERRSQYEQDQIIELTKKIWNSQVMLYNIIVKACPDIINGYPESVPYSVLDILTSFMKKTKELIPLKNKLLPKS
ncbi:MAG: hypothetical protein ACK4ND_18920 [Cytophagaceae bacterium]